MQRTKGQANQVPDGQKNQNYSFQSYTNPMSSSMAAAATATETPFISSYYVPSGPYQTYGVNDATWSNGGDHMQTFLGGYGGQMGYESHNAMDGMFGGGNFGTYNPANFNYGFPNSSDYTAWGSSDVRGAKQYEDYYPRDVYADDQVKPIDQGVQGLSLSDPNSAHDLQKDGSAVNRSSVTNGNANKISGGSNSPSVSENSVGLGQSKKGISWASVASQPAKPQLNRRREKTTQSIVPGKHTDFGIWDSKNGGGPKPVAPPPAPRPAWEATRGGSRSTSYSTPPPRTPPQASPQQQSLQATTAAISQIQPITPQAVVQTQPVPQQLSQVTGQVVVPLPVSGMRAELPPPMSGDGGSAYLPSSQSVQPVRSSRVLDDLHRRNEYNPKEFEVDPKNGRFFVIKSYSEDDIHRSIKYEIWCSTEHGNKRLDAAFQEREGKGPVFLFFSVNGSGHFCGIAQMTSQVDYNSSSSVWTQDKWKGQFRVKWIYVKDVPNNQLRHIRLENNENKPVTNSRDTQEVPFEKGKQILKIIHTFQHTTSMFDDFMYYEDRQEKTEHKKGHQLDGQCEDRRGDRDHHRDRYRGEYHPRGGFVGNSRGRGNMHHHRGGGGGGSRN